MNADKFFNIVGGIITIALVFTVVAPGSQSAGVIKSLGDAFSHSIASAQGRAQ